MISPLTAGHRLASPFDPIEIETDIRDQPLETTATPRPFLEPKPVPHPSTPSLLIFPQKRLQHPQRQPRLLPRQDHRPRPRRRQIRQLGPIRHPHLPHQPPRHARYYPGGLKRQVSQVQEDRHQRPLGIPHQRLAKQPQQLPVQQQARRVLVRERDAQKPRLRHQRRDNTSVQLGVDRVNPAGMRRVLGAAAAARAVSAARWVVRGACAADPGALH